MTHSGVQGLALVRQQYYALLVLIPVRIYPRIGSVHQTIYGMSTIITLWTTALTLFTKFRWLYRLFIGIDANFRAKRKQVSSDTKDPGLNAGIAYFVEENAYKSFLSQFDNLTVNDISTCNNHDAIAKAGSKRSLGLAATGIATIECTRHDMKRPCSIGDLQKGER